jgi:hypothetical protein
MRTFRTGALCAIALGIAGCVNDATQSRNPEPDTTAACLDAMVAAAADPDEAAQAEHVADNCRAMTLGVAGGQNRAVEQELQTQSLETVGRSLQSVANDMRATADAYRAGAAAIAASRPPLPPPPMAPMFVDLGYLHPRPFVPGYCMITPLGLTAACPH